MQTRQRQTTASELQRDLQSRHRWPRPVGTDCLRGVLRMTQERASCVTQASAGFLASTATAQLVIAAMCLVGFRQEECRLAFIWLKRFGLFRFLTHAHRREKEWAQQSSAGVTAVLTDDREVECETVSPPHKEKTKSLQGLFSAVSAPIFGSRQ